MLKENYQGVYTVMRTWFAALCKWKPGRSRYVAIPLVAKIFRRVGFLIGLRVSGAFGRTSHACFKRNTALRLVLFIPPDDTICTCRLNEEDQPDNKKYRSEEPQEWEPEKWIARRQWRKDGDHEGKGNARKKGREGGREEGRKGGRGESVRWISNDSKSSDNNSNHNNNNSSNNNNNNAEQKYKAGVPRLNCLKLLIQRHKCSTLSASVSFLFGWSANAVPGNSQTLAHVLSNFQDASTIDRIIPFVFLRQLIEAELVIVNSSLSTSSPLLLVR